MFKCPTAIKHDDNKDVAFLAVTMMECDKEGKKGFAIYGHWIIVSTNRDYLSESGMVFIPNEDIDKWKVYVPRK